MLASNRRLVCSASYVIAKFFMFETSTFTVSAMVVFTVSSSDAVGAALPVSTNSASMLIVSDVVGEVVAWTSL